MKTIEQEEKVCGNCIHRKLGISEVYCHKKDMYVNEDRPACRAHTLNPEAAEMKKKYIAPVVTPASLHIFRRDAFI